MKKTNLIIGIVSGAAAGVAATYLMDSANRKTLVSGLQSLSQKAMEPISNLLGSEEAENLVDMASPRRMQTSSTSNRKNRT